jgi:hypothetical protein
MILCFVVQYEHWSSVFIRQYWIMSFEYINRVNCDYVTYIYTAGEDQNHVKVTLGLFEIYK